MDDKDFVRLKHMLDSARAILSFARGKRKNSLRTDRLLASGIVHEFAVMGEAAGKVSKKTQNQLPELPWKQLTGMRNRLIHAYHDVDQEVLWKTIKDDLPNFCAQLEEILADLES